MYKMKIHNVKKTSLNVDENPFGFHLNLYIYCNNSTSKFYYKMMCQIIAH